MQVIAGLAVENEGGKMAGCVSTQQGLQDGRGTGVGQATVSGIQLDIPKNISMRLSKVIRVFFSLACIFYFK
jgi:hypothetical protein